LYSPDRHTGERDEPLPKSWCNSMPSYRSRDMVWIAIRSTRRQAEFVVLSRAIWLIEKR